MRWCSDKFGSVAAVVLVLATSSCVGERQFPKPAQMCENLVQECGLPILLEHESSIFRDCHAVGVAGVQDKQNEAQCFAFYDECINDCKFYGYYLALDSGADADTGTDAESPLDASADVLDAATRPDE